MARDIWQEVTDRIIEALEQGTAPWLKPWSNVAGANGLPYNGLSGRAYNGINVCLLWMTAQEQGYSEPRWYTFNQAKQAAGFKKTGRKWVWKGKGKAPESAGVRRGEKGTTIVFWKPMEKEVVGDDGKPKTERYLILRNYTVFNAAQCDGLPGQAEVPAVDPAAGYARAAELAEATGATIQHGGNKACFIPSLDLIKMPQAGQFKTREAYWATLLHELVHWTAAEGRIKRETGIWGTDAYACEELVAEIGSAFLCAELGIPHETLQHPSYIDHWIKVLKADKRAVIYAAAKARHASEFLLGCVDQAASEAA